MKRTLAAILTVTMLSAGLSGCGKKPDQEAGIGASQTSLAKTAPTQAAVPGQSETTAAGEPGKKEWFGTPDGQTVTLRFYGGVQPEYGYDQLCETFNEEYKDKGVQVEYVRYVNNTDGNLQLDIYLQGGGEVDVFMGYGGRSALNKRVEAGMVLDMSDYLKAYDFDLVKELGEINMQNYTYDNGECYGFPTKYENGSWLLINADMFQAAGVPIPYDGWTYSEFLDTLEKLTHGEGQDKVYGLCWEFNENWASHEGLLGSVLNPYTKYKDESAKEVNFDHDVWRQGLEVVKTTLDNGWAVSMEDEFSENIKCANFFMEEKCAVSLCIAMVRLTMDQENYPHDFTTALVPGPVPDGDLYKDELYRTHSLRTGAGDLICVAAKTPYPDAAFEFALWYLTGGMAPVAKGGRIPLWTGFDKDAVVAMIKENAGDSIEETSLRKYLSIDNTLGVKQVLSGIDSEIGSIYKEEVQAMAYGRQTVDETIEHLVSRCNKQLSEAAAR